MTGPVSTTNRQRPTYVEGIGQSNAGFSVVLQSPWAIMNPD